MLDSLKSALFTALWTFVGTTALLSVGWLQSLAGWASASGHAPLPGLSTIGYALVGALVSSVSGLVAFVVRAAQSKNVIPGNPPTFGPEAAAAQAQRATPALSTADQVRDLVAEYQAVIAAVRPSPPAASAPQVPPAAT